MGRVIAISIVVWFLLSGCSALNWPKPDAPKETKSQKLSIPEKEEKEVSELSRDAMSAQELLEFYESLYTAPKKELNKHKALAKARFEDGQKIDKGLEYSLVLLISGSNADLKAARSVVKKIKGGHQLEEGEGYIALITLLDNLLGQKSHFQDKITSLESVLEKREQELVILKKQLNALKNIDKNIHEREVGTSHEP